MSGNDEPKTRRRASDRDAYYDEARSWAQSRDEARSRSVRVAWIVAAVAAGVAVIEGLALIGLVPLKTVVPYTIMVDRNTGFAQVLEGNQPPPLRGETALTQAMLAQYVIAREGFDVNTVSEQYRRVALWSADRARADYLALMPADNPDSPVARYGRHSVVTTTIESVSPLTANQAQTSAPAGVQSALVRFYTERRDQQGSNTVKAYWVAVLRYRFSGQPMALDDRLNNPLGFQVVEYRRDQEAPPPAEPLPTRPEPGATPTAPGTGNPLTAPVPGASGAVTSDPDVAPGADRRAMPQQPLIPYSRPQARPPRPPRQPSEDVL